MIDINLVVGVCLLLPVLGAFLVLIFGSRPNVRETATLLTGGLTFWHVWGLLHHVREGALRLDPLVTAELPLSGVAEALEALREGRGARHVIVHSR